MSNIYKKIAFPIGLLLVAACQPSWSNAHGSAEDIVLSNYNKAEQIVKSQSGAHQIESLNTILEAFIDQETILEKICPGYAHLSEEKKAQVKEVVIKKIVKIYVNIFRIHCKTGQHLSIKESKPMGSHTKVKAAVKHPNTGQMVRLDFIIQNNKLVDIFVNDSLSLLKGLETQGKEIWRKSNHNIDQFMELYSKI